VQRSRSLYLRVGALVLAGLGLALGFVLFLTANRPGDSAVMFETYLRESVQGLEVGAAVRYRGVSIGRVEELGLVSAEYQRAEGETFGPAFQLVFVRFSVDTRRVGEGPTVEDAIRLGLRARIAAAGITGVYYVELDFVDPERFPFSKVPWEPRHTFIPAIPSTVAQVQNAAEVLLQQLQGVDVGGLLQSLAGLLSDLRQETRENGDLAVTLREAAGLLRTLRTAAEEGDLPGLLGELRGAAAEARGTAAEARELVASREARQLLANAAAAAAEVRTAAARLPATIAALESGLRVARGASTEIQAELAPILRDLRSAVGNLRDTTEALRRSPGQALFGAPPPPERR
jgi:phospholipid/cholesterol/gamma-HCH transport system substrate-binding protein